MERTLDGDIRRGQDYHGDPMVTGCLFRLEEGTVRLLKGKFLGA